jgi:hypothetical protein
MADYTVNEYKQAAFLVYINGLEIPVVSLTANYGVWTMPTLSIDMVPHPMLARIGSEDRLQVAVFYLDYHWDPENPQFCLLGEFEVVGWGYSNVGEGMRSIQLQCVSQIQILEQLHFFYISSLDDIVTSCGGSVGSNPQTATQVKLLYPTSLFLEGLTSPSSVQVDSPGTGDTQATADNFIKRPIDFVTNIFRALLRPVASEGDFDVDADSEFLPRGATSVPGKNFFARWMKMTGFHRRWAAMPLLEDEGSDGCFPLVKAVQDTNTLPALQQQIGQSIGNAGSAWQLLKQVLGYMYMEIGMIPCPPNVSVEKKSGIIKGAGATVKADFKSLVSYFVKPQCTFALPPACNVVFPSMVDRYTFAETYITQPTRIYLGESFISNVINQSQNGGVSTLVKELLTTGFPLEVKKRMQDMAEAQQANNKNYLLFPEEFFKGPISKRMNAPPWMYMLSQQEAAYTTKQTAFDLELEQFAGSDAGAPLGKLFDLYAEYEYFRARYAERSGGVSLAWNPYIVPGFPLAVFDDREAALDTMGYVNQMTLSMAAGDPPHMSTTVNLSFMRTMHEFLGLMGKTSGSGASEASSDYDIAPVEVIPEISDAFQKTSNAKVIYEGLFYRNESMAKSSVFNWRDMLDMRNLEGDILDITTYYGVYDPFVKLTPKGEYSDLFESYDAAMRYASRPVCTLQEYIETWHGRSLNDLIEDGVVRGEYRSFYSPASDRGAKKGAIFWGRIFKLAQGPGNTPPTEVTNMGSAPDFETAGDDAWTTVSPEQGVAQTREDWDTILEEYRKIVRSEEGRLGPQG